MKELEEEGESVMLEPDESHYYKYIGPGRLLGHEVEHRPGVRIARREQGRALVIRATLRRIAICGIAAFSSCRCMDLHSDAASCLALNLSNSRSMSRPMPSRGASRGPRG